MLDHPKNILCNKTFWVAVAGSLVGAAPGFAVEIPGAADVGRVKPEMKAPAAPAITRKDIYQAPSGSAAPKGADQVHLTLKHIDLQGVTAFDPAVFTEFYADLLQKDITLDKAWVIAAQITDYYRAHGFFLSRALVPAQEVERGTVTIQVVEGYVAAVELPDDLRDIRLVRAMVKKITAQRPLSLPTVESVLLRLNDLPGLSLRSVFEPMTGTDGASRLTLLHQAKSAEAFVQLDDYGSRYTGPWQASASFHGALIPLQDTTLYGVSSLPASELKYGSIQQRIPLSFAADLLLQAGHSASAPGYNLRAFDIKGDSSVAALGLTYTLLRQRQESLQLHTLLELRNSNTDSLGATLVRDRVRVARLGARFDHADAWNGVNTYDVTVSQGLSALGASSAHNPNPSRAGAKPQFTKEEITYSRWQGFGHGLNLLLSATAQRASGVLYSSEEIGYGGQVYGRAYDSSELTGNQGAMAMAELRYTGLGDFGGIRGEPYAFYDIGKVWNSAANQPKAASAASAGLGIRLTSEWNVSGDFTLAQPLTHDATAPLSGNGDGPRFLGKLLYRF